MVAAAVAAFGRLDVLHNNAALTDSPTSSSRDTAVTELSLDVWDRTMAVNLRSQMLMCKHAVPEMVEARRRLHHQHVLGRRRSRAIAPAPPTGSRRPASTR